MKFPALVTLAMVLSVSARPRPDFMRPRSADTELQNGQDAIAENNRFKTLTANSPCTHGETACVNDKFAGCVGTKWALQSCAGGLICASLPNSGTPGTTLACTTAADRDSRIAATGAKIGSNNNQNQNTGSGKAATAKPSAVPNTTKGTGTGKITQPSTKSSATGKVSSVASATAKVSKVTSATAKVSTVVSGTVQVTTAISAPVKATQVGGSITITEGSTQSTATPNANGDKGGDNAANGTATGGQAGDNSDPQKSLTLSPASIQPAYSNDGNADPSAGQEPSTTSTNNFINFCLQFPDTPQTNGQQVLEGSCNQTPMGVIVAQSKMPAAKFQNPANGETIPANKNFTISVLIRNMELGHFTNPNTAYHMAPQQVNLQGLVKGHSHVTVQKLASLNSKEPLDSREFAFFKGLNDKSENGVLSVVVPGGLPKGFYRAATIVAAANHQPALVAVAQRGSLDDMVYFTVA